MKKKGTSTQKRKRREAEEIEEADAFPQLNNVDEVDSDDEAQNVPSAGNENGDADEAVEHSDVEDFEVTRDYINQDTREGSDNENENEFNDASSHSSMNYDSEDSENERTLSTIGNVPLEWYDEYDHVGYDLEGKKITKPRVGMDKIDQFVETNEDPTAWRTLYDERLGRRVFISDREMEMIKRIRRGVAPDRYEPENWFIRLTDHDDHIHPISNKPARKDNFIPSKWEAKRIRYLSWAIKKGIITVDKDKKEEKKEPSLFLIWDDNINDQKRREILPAPKQKLPGHAESYNPPAEYLFDDKELHQFKNSDPEERHQDFVPQKYDRLRHVPAYSRLQVERFNRLLDLYLATRTKRKKLEIDPQTLVPKLPRPEELKPFPTQESVQYLGHTDRVRSISVDPTGQWLITGSDDKTVRLWEVSTGRCMRQWTFPDVILVVEWNPNVNLHCFAVGTEDELFIVEPGFGSETSIANTTKLFLSDEDNNTEAIQTLVEWRKPNVDDWEDKGFRLRIRYKSKNSLKKLTWHHKGDYLATVSPDANSSAVLIHSISKRQTQSPFKKNKGRVETVKFHPSKPFFFVATQKHIRVYNLSKQQLFKKLVSNVQWISSMDIHPAGDNLIIGSYDKRVVWFDLDFGLKPYKVLRYHQLAVRAVAYHHQFPLFASCSDDGNIHVFHGMVYNDLLQNAMIVPLKILKGHQVVDDLGVLNIMFHPTQPWIFSSGADSTVRLFT